MSIKIGQLRKNNSTDYLTDVSYLVMDILSSTSGESTNFTNRAIQASFMANTTYYVRVDINRLNINDNYGNSGTGTNDPHVLNIEVKLYDNNGNYQTIGDLLVIEPYDSETGLSNLEKETNFISWCNACIVDSNPSIGDYEGAEEYFTNLVADHNEKINPSISESDIRTPIKMIELVFTPYTDSVRLVFELRRVAYDYNYPNARKVTFYNDADLDVCSVNNILPANIDEANKIGIQSEPGSLVIINNEGMRIGKSGVLEINSGIGISKVGFAAPNENINDFILDYIYTE